MEKLKVERRKLFDRLDDAIKRKDYKELKVIMLEFNRLGLCVSILNK